MTLRQPNTHTHRREKNTFNEEQEDNLYEVIMIRCVCDPCASHVSLLLFGMCLLLALVYEMARIHEKSSNHPVNCNYAGCFCCCCFLLFSYCVCVRVLLVHDAFCDCYCPISHGTGPARHSQNKDKAGETNCEREQIYNSLLLPGKAESACERKGDGECYYRIGVGCDTNRERK